MPKKSTKRNVKKSTKTASKDTKIVKKGTNWSKHLAKAEFVSLSDIKPDKKFRCREHEHEPTVKKYARDFKAYQKNRDDVNAEEKLAYPFPPIVFWRSESRKDGKYILVAGFHRYHAAEKAEFDPIFAQEFIGTEKEARQFALEDNRHGRKLSSSDLKYAIGIALKEFPDFSQGRIAQMLGCDRTYVSRIRKQLVTSHGLTEQETTVGLDGKVRKTARKAQLRVVPTQEDDEKPFFDYDDEPTKEDNKPVKASSTFLPSEEEFDKKKGKTLRDQIAYLYTILEKLTDKIAEEHPTDENRIALYKQMSVWADAKKNGIVRQPKQE